MEKYPVNKLSKMAGVSVRTLHHYDRIGLLRPSFRTAAGYRLYGPKELFRLQQILFYKELDFKLKEIGHLLDDPDFDLISALQSQREMLKGRKQRLDRLIVTINNTIKHLKNELQMNYEDLYEGLPREQAEAWQKEARARWPQQLDHAEKTLMTMKKADFQALQEDFKANWEQLARLSGHAPDSPEVQAEIGRHYAFILKFWGKSGNQAAAYQGLGNLYAEDQRYTIVNGLPNPAFGRFMQKAIEHFVTKNL